MNQANYRFEINDEVFFMSGNKIRCGKIVNVSISIGRKEISSNTPPGFPDKFEKTFRIEYKVVFKISQTQNSSGNFSEDMLFESKSKLIDTL